MSKKRLIALLIPFFLFFACIHKEKVTETGLQHSSIPPKRVLVMVFDQMRPDFVERFGLKNFQWLEKNSIRFSNAYVGHLGSITVVSHAVISTGLLPKHLPWRDDLMKDSDGLLGKKGAYYSAVDLTQAQYFSLMQGAKNTTLAQQLKSAPFPAPSVSPLPGEPKPGWGKVFSIGQKFYAAMVYGGPAIDSIITLGQKRKEDPLKGWKEPVGFNVPNVFLNPFGGRYFLDCNSNYGSQNTLYPLDGNRFYPGSDAKHIGGDQWVSDGVVQLMLENPDWRGIFATFGSIDKVLHMLGEHDTPTKEAWAVEQGIGLKNTLQNADQALGQILDTLKSQNLLNETLIIVTADHGGQANKFFHGINQPGLGTSYFEYGKGENFENWKIAPALKSLFDTGMVDVSSHDSMLRMWLKKHDRVSIAHFADKMRPIPGVAEIYTKQETGKNAHYIRTYRSPELTAKALEWAKSHNQELVESMAAQGSPDVLALLLDNHGYALIGEHGGAQEEVQRIPFYVSSPNLKDSGTVNETPVRLVDVNPIVGKVMHLPENPNLDGTSRAIDGYVITEKAK